MPSQARQAAGPRAYKGSVGVPMAIVLGPDYDSSERLTTTLARCPAAAAAALLRVLALPLSEKVLDSIQSTSTPYACHHLRQPPGHPAYREARQ